MGNASGHKGRGRARTIMVQGTASHAGKSLITAALLRILRRRGVEAAPFKAQNMALNSFVTADGREIGMAQALQAEAAGVEPTADMNPVLLKPSGDSIAQVIVQGRVYGKMTAKDYHAFKKEAKRFALASLDRLRASCDVVVMEGAGSPAEVNLRRNDLANMGMALEAKSPVVIVGDIDRGGVLASLVGTMALLSRRERALVKGFIINKFRGDYSILRPGLTSLRKMTGVETLGVVPFINDLLLPEEDSVGLPVRRGRPHDKGGGVRIAVVRLPRISNFTDFDPLACEGSVALDFVDGPGAIRGADIVIIPGSKNTIGDMLWMRRAGLDRAIIGHAASGKTVAGVCGGFQMLGTKISDPLGVESGVRETGGLGLIDAHTVLRSAKKTRRVEGEVALPGFEGTRVRGYEIHMGETAVGPKAGGRFCRIRGGDGRGPGAWDGAYDKSGKVWGTYLHGIFDNDGFRRAFLEAAAGGRRAGKKGLDFRLERDRRLDALASTVQESLDMERVFEIIGI